MADHGKAEAVGEKEWTIRMAARPK